MNCKPGDLAVIVRASDRFEHAWVGRVIRVTHLSGVGLTGLPCWAYEGPRLHHRLFGDATAIADEVLRPLRDPGDDAVDEVLRRIGSPNEVTA
ncbi:hypothetical protein [Hydrogenophaga sp. T2]|uniref:hypothetical protein n=1 Tax=Hydrogenophaga sp. T2 TaxID=3132823 RepID=UPI003CEEAE53